MTEEQLYNHAICPDCGPADKCDEDRCCLTCGADLVLGDYIDEIMKELKERREAGYGADRAVAERIRQKSVEGWTPEHDSQHDQGELAIAAACYALNKMPAFVDLWWANTCEWWPWHPDWDKREKHDRERSLEIAAALIMAELDRIRAALARAEEAEMFRADMVAVVKDWERIANESLQQRDSALAQLAEKEKLVCRMAWSIEELHEKMGCLCDADEPCIHRAALYSSSPCRHAKEAERLEEALVNLMKSSDASWYSGSHGGHDWRETVDAAHMALVKYGRKETP